MSFDIEPHGDPHGECSAEIKRLNAEIQIIEELLVELKLSLQRRILAFEYLVSMLPEDCTAGFVTHARAIASGDPKAIERTK